jgi:hypothetical protein
MLPTCKADDRLRKVDAVEVHHQVNDAAALFASPAEPSVLAEVDGKPVRAMALPSIATDGAPADELETDAPQRDPAAMDFMEDRHLAGAGDSLGVKAPHHDAPPSVGRPAAQRDAP